MSESRHHGCEPGLLVSVRCVEEAEAALRGGAALIDVKEPARGSLGRADDVMIAAVVAHVAGRRPVSAAMGELIDHRETAPAGLAYVKWGLAGCGRHSAWRPFLTERLERVPPPQSVIVAYADWECAQAPPLDVVAAFAMERRGNVLLVDTHCKERQSRHESRPTLLDWLSVNEIVALCARCRAHGVRIALAGSLGLGEIATLKCAGPDWFAVRGAACIGADRAGRVDAGRVRMLVDLLSHAERTPPLTAATNAS